MRHRTPLMSALSWIDFDQADRDRTRRIMDLFSEKEARDELGLGSVRDAISDLLFPGTSTIQTRLRYMMFVSTRTKPAAPPVPMMRKMRRGNTPPLCAVPAPTVPRHGLVRER